MFDIERVRASWQRESTSIDAIIDGINDMTALEPIRADGWSTQDLVGHIANAARGFLAYIRGDATQGVNIDEFNEQKRQQGRQRSWTDVQAYWRRARDEVAAFLANADNGIADQPATIPHLPQVKTAGEALRILIIHTRSHREELELGFPPAQA